ncbi:MAG: hypothetical protein Q7K41_04925 [Dehalococcoidales bacterium]|nr:hypothetical protein [Dehalococcoidales bacterium]
MIDLLLRLTDSSIPVDAVAAEGAAEFSGSGTIGFIVLAIIIGPVVLLTLAAMFGAPRNFRIPGLFVGSVILLIGGLVASLAVIGRLLQFIVPQ